MSSEAIRLLGTHGVDVVFLDYDGNVIARISPPELRTVAIRKEQYYAYKDERGLILSKEFVKAKMRNQMAVLGSLAKRRKDTSPEVAQNLQTARNQIEILLGEIEKIKGLCVDEVRESLQGFEGTSSRMYWTSLSETFPPELGFQGRTGRYAQDPVNSMLNYGYGILQGEVLRAIHFAGLDPYGGYLHVDRSGRSSLVFDVMEEFRQQVVDKIIIRLVARNQVQKGDFAIEGDLCRMSQPARKLLLKEVLSRLEDFVRLEDRKIAWCNVILEQARKIAHFLRGEEPYTGFYLRW